MERSRRFTFLLDLSSLFTVVKDPPCAIYSVLSFLAPIIVVFLTMERECPRDGEGLG